MCTIIMRYELQQGIRTNSFIRMTLEQYINQNVNGDIIYITKELLVTCLPPTFIVLQVTVPDDVDIYNVGNYTPNKLSKEQMNLVKLALIK